MTDIIARGIGISNKKELENVSSQLAETETRQTNDFRMNLKEMLKYPSGFSFPVMLHIFKDSFGNFSVKDFDIEALHPLGKRDGKAYYVSKNGNDTNDGLTLATAFKNLPVAFGKTDVDTIYIESGQYGRQHCYGQNLPDRNIKIKALNGKVTLGCFENPTIAWTEHSPGVYKFSRSGVVNVYDTKVLNDFGNYTRYTRKTALTEVESTPGTWFLDASNMLFVHTLDNRQPANDYDIKVVISGYTIESTRNKSYYFEGIDFEFGNSALKISNSPLFLSKDCNFNYSQMSNGLSIIDSDMTITQNCKACENYADGFNYHADNWSNKQLYCLEIDNIGYRNGFSGATIANNNGSTVHVNCIAMRVNGLYFENFGPNCADVGTRQKTWNIGCTAYDSRQSPTAIDFLTENEMWLESCYAYKSAMSLYTQFVDAKIYTRNTKWFGAKFVKTPENLINY